MLTTKTLPVFNQKVMFATQHHQIGVGIIGHIAVDMMTNYKLSFTPFRAIRNLTDNTALISFNDCFELPIVPGFRMRFCASDTKSI